MEEKGLGLGKVFVQTSLILTLKDTGGRMHVRTYATVQYQMADEMLGGAAWLTNKYGGMAMAAYARKSTTRNNAPIGQQPRCPRAFEMAFSIAEL